MSTADGTLALMWEAKAVPGERETLLEWARAQPLAHAPSRREHFTAPGERVLVITWWEGAAYDTDVPELPDPPGDLAARPVHRWRFERA